MASDQTDSDRLPACPPLDVESMAIDRSTSHLAAGRRTPKDRRDGRSRGRGRGDGSGSRDSVELVLYVNGESPKTQSAVKTIEEAISRYAPERVTLTICDLSKQPPDGNADGITITPALVRRSPSPRTFILGHITNPEVVADLIQSCDDDAR